jgi:hypothetical protein
MNLLFSLEKLITIWKLLLIIINSNNPKWEIYCYQMRRNTCRWESKLEINFIQESTPKNKNIEKLSA